MSGIIYSDGHLTVTLEEDGVRFEREVSTPLFGEVELPVIMVSRAAMREIISGYHRELDQEREEHGSD